MKSAGCNLAHSVFTGTAACLTIALEAMRGQASQAMLHTPIFSEDRSEDIIHYNPALACLADKVCHQDVLGMLLVFVKGVYALEI